MVKLIERTKKDPKKIHDALQKGYRTKHPENIVGYAGFFYDLGDVYVSDTIDKRMKSYEPFQCFVMESIRKFEDGDYGDISELDLDENIENRYLFGIPRLLGRYGFEMHRTRLNEMRYREIIRIRQWGSCTFIMYETDLDTEFGLQWPLSSEGE